MSTQFIKNKTEQRQKQVLSYMSGYISDLKTNFLTNFLNNYIAYRSLLLVVSQHPDSIFFKKNDYFQDKLLDLANNVLLRHFILYVVNSCKN